MGAHALGCCQLNFVLSACPYFFIICKCCLLHAERERGEREREGGERERERERERGRERERERERENQSISPL